MFIRISGFAQPLHNVHFYNLEEEEESEKWTNVQGSVPVGFQHGNKDYTQFRYQILPGYEEESFEIVNCRRDEFTSEYDGWTYFNIYRTDGSYPGFLSITASPVTYRVDYNANGGEDNSVPEDNQSYSVVGEKTIYIPSTVPTHADEQYSFQGWALSPNGEAVYLPNTTAQLEEALDAAGVLDEGMAEKLSRCLISSPDGN